MRRLYLFALLLLAVYDTGAWGQGSEKVKLKDIDVLTLRVGHFTTGRRSAPVPQIRCVGGTAGCSAFVPQVVQCYNRGFDGYDVNWECKADMDNEFRFGEIAVTCEGYDYPDDPYILRGSCGFEYNLDLTKEGINKKNAGAYQDSYSQSNSYSDYIKPVKKKNDLFSLETLTLVIGVGIAIYAIYKTCIAPRDDVRYQGSTTNDDYDNGRPRPPPYGFNVPPTAPPMDDSCPGSSGSCGPQARPSSSSSSFWTGAATGGLLGYMFGSSGNRGSTAYDRTAPRSSSWFGGNSGPSTSSSSYSYSSPSSSGTREASGFGGTRRR